MMNGRKTKESIQDNGDDDNIDSDSDDEPAEEIYQGKTEREKQTSTRKTHSFFTKTNSFTK
jgi:hypothetical protein